MRLETRTVRIGECVEPIDWAYDFEKDYHSLGRGVPCDQWIAERISLLEACHLGPAEVTCDGGWPRVGWGRLLRVGMYDGWPYWRPVPSVLTQGPIGVEWHSYQSITGVRAMLARAAMRPAKSQDEEAGG